VMTAGHCVKTEEFDGDVYVGVHNLEKDLTQERKHEVKQAHLHPNYSYIFNIPNYDYAILELSDPILMKSHARAIFLPEENDEYSHDALFLMTGWGKMGLTEPSSDKLLGVTVPWVSPEDCQNAYGHENVTEHMICSGHQDGEIGSCRGDSGGPVAWLDPNSHRVKLVGAVSWGHNACAAQGPYPNVAADMRRELEWVIQVTGNCNEETCNEEGICMTKTDLEPSVVKRFETVTPHLQK